MNPFLILIIILLIINLVISLFICLLSSNNNNNPSKQPEQEDNQVILGHIDSLQKGLVDIKKIISGLQNDVTKKFNEYNSMVNTIEEAINHLVSTNDKEEQKSSKKKSPLPPF